MKKKLIAILAGILAFAVIVVGFKFYMNAKISDKAAGIRNHRTYERYWSSDVQRLIMDEDTLPVFGSSELVSLSEYENGVGSFLNGEDMNIVTIGGGNFQSLSHTMSLGAMADSISRNKVALFLSPQWFAPDGVDPIAFAARFSEDNLLQLLKNDKISKENKQYVLDRTAEMLDGSPTQLARVNRYRKALKNNFSIDYVYTKIMTEFWSYRSEYAVYKQLKNVNENLPNYDLSKLDFNSMLELAEKQGDAACTNNEFGIYNEYFDTYVRDAYEKGEVLDKEQVFDFSVEYDDLQCFLSVAEELGIEVILVSIPVNAKWYSYRGQLCDVYYENIRQIATGYDNVNFVDMSEYENEKYFLKDIMHLGWKGWARINEKLYNAFTQ